MLHGVQRIIFAVTQGIFLRYLQANINVNFSLRYCDIFFFFPLPVSTGEQNILVSEIWICIFWGEEAASLESAIVPPSSPHEVLRSTSHPIEKFSVGKGLPLFPSRGRFTLIQVTPAKSGSDRWIRVLNYHDAHGRVSRPPRRKLKSARATLAKFTILSFRISAAFISNNSDGRNRYFYSACLFERKSRKAARLHTQEWIIFLWTWKRNGGRVFNSRPNFAILLLITRRRLERARENICSSLS